MAFSLSDFDKLGAAGNPNVREIYSYISTADTLATISASAYFNDVANYLKIGDTIFLNGSDGVNNVDVTAVSPNVTVADATTVAADSITSAEMSPSLLKYTTTVMTSAQFLGAFAAPHLLVAAPGANTLLVPEQFRFVMTHGGTNYADGGVAHVQWDSTASGAGVIASSTLAAATFYAAASTTLTMNAGVVAAPFTTTVNKGLYFSNITGAFTTGDSDFVVHTWYREISTV